MPKLANDGPGNVSAVSTRYLKHPMQRQEETAQSAFGLDQTMAQMSTDWTDRPVTSSGMYHSPTKSIMSSPRKRSAQHPYHRLRQGSRPAATAPKLLQERRRSELATGTLEMYKTCQPVSKLQHGDHSSSQAAQSIPRCFSSYSLPSETVDWRFPSSPCHSEGASQSSPIVPCLSESANWHSPTHPRSWERGNQRFTSSPLSSEHDCSLNHSGYSGLPALAIVDAFQISSMEWEKTRSGCTVENLRSGTTTTTDESSDDDCIFLDTLSGDRNEPIIMDDSVSESDSPNAPEATNMDQQIFLKVPLLGTEEVGVTVADIGLDNKRSVADESDAAQPCEVSIPKEATPRWEIVTEVSYGAVGAACLFDAEVLDDGTEGVGIQNVKAQDLEKHGIEDWVIETRIPGTFYVATSTKYFATPNVKRRRMETCGAEMQFAEVPKLVATGVEAAEVAGESTKNLFFCYLGHLEAFFSALGNLTPETKSAMVDALMPSGHIPLQRIFKQLRTISGFLFSSHDCPRVDRLEVELSMLLDDALTRLYMEVVTPTVSASEFLLDGIPNDAGAVSVPTLCACGDRSSGTAAVIQEQDAACGIADCGEGAAKDILY